MFKDPVCNMIVDENKTKFVSESGDGRKVYLRSTACKNQLESNPKVWLLITKVVLAAT